MSNIPGAKPIHTVYSDVYNHAIDKKPQLVQDLYNKPHLAIFINGDWLPILPGFIIGLVTDRTKIDGIAPYRLLRVRTKTGKEQIDLAAYSTDGRNTRLLKLGAKYSGQFVSGIRDADQAIDAAVNATKLGDDDDE